MTSSMRMARVICSMSINSLQLTAGSAIRKLHQFLKSGTSSLKWVILEGVGIKRTLDEKIKG